VKLIFTYISKEYIKVFAITLFVFASLFTIINFFEKMEVFIRYQVTLSDSIEYLLLKLPSIFIQIIPFAALLTTLIIIGMMKSRNEILALRCSGASIKALIFPVAILGIILSMFEFYLNENIVTTANRRLRLVERVKIKKGNPLQSLGSNEIWFRNDRSFYRIDLFLPDRMTAFGITILTFGEKFNLVKRVDARETVWINKKWVAKDIATRIFFEDRSTYNYEKEMPINLPYTPEELKNEEIKPDEMNFYQLRKYLNKMKSYGYSIPAYRTDLFFKISFPVGVMIISVIGIPISLKRFTKPGIGTNILIALTLGFLYWFLSAISRIAGASMILPPVAASWIPNITFAIVGIYLFKKIDW